ncbi:MAG: signal peptidase I [Myxococcaceae bacterium]|nr:signal peptidase I [Myxococcaceae bacterium]
MAARLSPELRAKLRRVHWENRLTSLWAPVTLFGGVFVLYLFIVELHTPSAAWARPALKGFGLLMLIAFVALAVARTAMRPFARLRKLRHQTFEFLGEISDLVDKHRDKVTGRPNDDLLEHAVTLAGALATRDARLEEELKAAEAAADKHLAAWRKQSIFDFGMGFVKAFAIAMVIRTIFIEPFRIPSGSMIPTLQIGDQIFVNKFIYGVRIPFINEVPFVIVRRPERGDVIVFNNPLDESRDFIKRVIGVPGDTVELRDGVVYINGVAQPRELVQADYVYWDAPEDMRGNTHWISNEIALYRENLDGHVHLAGEALSGPRRDGAGPFKVPEGHVFVMGDNRDNSADSRFGFGVRPGVAFVPYGNIKGKAMVIWLALGHDGLGSGLTGGTGLRTDRLFLPVR